MDFYLFVHFASVMNSGNDIANLKSKKNQNCEIDRNFDSCYTDSQSNEYDLSYDNMNALDYSFGKRDSIELLRYPIYIKKIKRRSKKSNKLMLKKYKEPINLVCDDTKYLNLFSDLPPQDKPLCLVISAEESTSNTDTTKKYGSLNVQSKFIRFHLEILKKIRKKFYSLTMIDSIVTNTCLHFIILELSKNFRSHKDYQKLYESKFNVTNYDPQNIYELFLRLEEIYSSSSVIFSFASLIRVWFDHNLSSSNRNMYYISHELNFHSLIFHAKKYNYSIIMNEIMESSMINEYEIINFNTENIYDIRVVVLSLFNYFSCHTHFYDCDSDYYYLYFNACKTLFYPFYFLKKIINENEFYKDYIYNNNLLGMTIFLLKAIPGTGVGYDQFSTKFIGIKRMSRIIEIELCKNESFKIKRDELYNLYINHHAKQNLNKCDLFMFYKYYTYRIVKLIGNERMERRYLTNETNNVIISIRYILCSITDLLNRKEALDHSMLNNLYLELKVQYENDIREALCFLIYFCRKYLTYKVTRYLNLIAERTLTNVLFLLERYAFNDSKKNYDDSNFCNKINEPDLRVDDKLTTRFEMLNINFIMMFLIEDYCVKNKVKVRFEGQK